MRTGIAHHFGWAVAVTASDDHQVVDRRRIELVEPGTPSAPIHHEGKDLDEPGAAALVAEVRASAQRATAAALERLSSSLGRPIRSLSLRDWPDDFPTDLATLRRAPYEARADSVMYLQVLARCAEERGWPVHRFDARQVEAQAADLLADDAQRILHGPRAALGPPWNTDHRMALAATVVAARQ